MAAVLCWQRNWLLGLLAVAFANALVAPPLQPTCQRSEVVHNGVCYGLTTDVPRSFNTARLRLLGKGNLPRVASAALNTKLLALLSLSGAKSAYIGLNDQITEGNFSWTVGVPLVSADYQNWATAGKGPTNYEDVSDCVVITNTAGEWAAVNCNDERAYFYAIGVVSVSEL